MNRLITLLILFWTVFLTVAAFNIVATFLENLTFAR